MTVWLPAVAVLFFIVFGAIKGSTGKKVKYQFWNNTGISVVL